MLHSSIENCQLLRKVIGEPMGERRHRVVDQALTPQTDSITSNGCATLESKDRSSHAIRCAARSTCAIAITSAAKPADAPTMDSQKPPQISTSSSEFARSAAGNETVTRTGNQSNRFQPRIAGQH